MYKAIAAGTRVIWNGQEGTVRFDSSETWRTASIEFDDDKGSIIQKEKSELTITSEVEGVWKEVGHVDGEGLVTQPSALAKMVEKLDKRDKRTSRGYVTKRDELVSILSEVSKMVPAVIAEEELPYSRQNGEISVKITLTLTLERDKL